MDPLPSATASMAASETWSVASSSIIDTQSEPPRCYGKQADKIMRRSAASPSNSNSSSVSAGGSKSSKSSSASAKNKVAPSPSPSPPTMTLTTKLSNSKLLVDEQRQQPSTSSKAVESKASTATSGGRSKKSKKSQRSSNTNNNTTSSSSSKSKQPSPSSFRSTASSHILSSRSKATTTAATDTVASVRHSRDPSSSLPSYHPGPGPGQSTAQSSNLAIVPHQQQQQQQSSSAIDPPSGESTSGSSSSTAEECNGPTLYDPPSTNSYSSSTQTSSQSQRSRDLSQSQSQNSSSNASNVSASIQSSHRHRGPPPQASTGNHEQLAVWNEECSEEDDESGYVAREVRQGSSNTNSGSQSTSSSYYSDDPDTATRGTELVSAVERALAIRDQRSEGTHSSRSHSSRSSNEVEEDEFTDAKDARAIVASNDYGGVNSFDEGGGNGEQLLVERDNNNRYLSAAVDNYNAIVPIDSAIYEAYDHTFVTCPEALRFRFLYTFLKKNLDKKVMIFFSTTNSVKFHAKLLEHFHIPGVLTMHGKQRREKFINRFFTFSDLEEGILCATDAAGRDLDIPPSVDWVIQFEPPDDPSEYILRVARISCDSDRVGRSLLFLNSGEQGFLKYYHSASIPVSEFEIPVRSLADVQSKIEYHVNESERLLQSARDAYGSYLIAYASHGFRDVYNVHDLNKTDVATAFGLVGGLSPDDDLTAETDTLASYSYVGGAELGHEGSGERRSRSSGDKGGGRKWEKKEKTKSKTWMRGEKSWPHSQIKLHPKFTGKDKGGSSGESVVQEESSQNGKDDKGRTRDYLWA